MYEGLKAKAIKDARRNNKWPKHLSEFHRYATLKIGAIVFMALIEKPRGVGLMELMRMTGKSRKTIKRIVAVWEELGVPIYTIWNGEHELIYKVMHPWGEKFKEKLY